jgi:aminoglycoside phosphotransferase (APT) family kinase protein
MTEESLVTAPPAAGVRVPWAEVPAAVRAAVEELVGDRVVAAVTQLGGFSPGVAARLRLAGGGRAFVKATGPHLNPDSPGLHRAEARITAALPASAPVPRLLGSLDRDGWVVLALEDVAGAHPVQPWREDELRRVLEAATELSKALTPSPIEAPRLADALDEQFQGWRRLANAHRDGEDTLSWLDPWSRANVDRLAALEDAWSDAAAGDTLLHNDMRADNILLTPDRVVFVDWPWAAIGAPWTDLVGMTPSVLMQGGPALLPVIEEHVTALGADPDAVTAVLAALTGYFMYQSHQPPPPGLPTVRAFQRAQGEAALPYLRRRLEAGSRPPGGDRAE